MTPTIPIEVAVVCAVCRAVTSDSAEECRVCGNTQLVRLDSVFQTPLRLHDYPSASRALARIKLHEYRGKVARQ